LTLGEQSFSFIAVGEGLTFLGKVQDVLCLVANSFDLLQQQRETKNRSNIGGALHRDVHYQFATEFLFGLVDALVGGAYVVGNRRCFGVGEERHRGKVKRVARVAEHGDRPSHYGREVAFAGASFEE